MAKRLPRNKTLVFSEITLYKTGSTCESEAHTVFPKPFLYRGEKGRWVYWACASCGPQSFCRHCGKHNNDPHTAETMKVHGDLHARSGHSLMCPSPKGSNES